MVEPVDFDVTPKPGLTHTPAIQVGHPTVLVNNAGIQNNRLLLDLDEREIDR